MTYWTAFSHNGITTGVFRFLKFVPVIILDTFIIFLAYSVLLIERTLDNVAVFDQWVRCYFCFAALTIVSLALLKAYQRIWSQTSGHDVVVIVKAVAWATLSIMVIDRLFWSHSVSVADTVITSTLSLSGLVAVRFRSRLISGANWRWRAIWFLEFPKCESRILIIGAGNAGQSLALQLKRHHVDNASSTHYKVVGFVDDDPQKQGRFVEGYPILGTCQNIPTVAEKNGVDLIVVALPQVTGPNFRQILSYCEQTKARIKIAPDVFALLDSTKNCAQLRDVQPEDLLGRRSIVWHESVDSAPIRKKVVMVTGAAGSIGSELCRQVLAYEPAKLILLDNNESGLFDLFIELSAKAGSIELQSVLADITHRETLSQLFASLKPQVVFHSAAYKHVPMLEDHPNEAIRVNIGGTRNVAELACKYKAERFVFISTDKAVSPCSVMGASKRICELLVSSLAQKKTHKTLLTAVRFGNVLGSRGSVVPIFNRQIEAGGPVKVTDPNMTRYFMSIPEAANLVIQAACLTDGNDLFMLQMGDAVRITELAERMIRMRGLRPYVDIPIEFSGIRPGEKLCEELNEDFELAQPTVHPDILKLVCKKGLISPQKLEFWVNALLENGLYYNFKAIDQLLAIIEASEKNEEPIKTGASLKPEASPVSAKPETSTQVEIGAKAETDKLKQIA